MIAIIILCCVIFNFSSENGPKSSGTSGKVASFLLDVFADGKNMSHEEKQADIELIQPFVRKGAHFSIYIFLSIIYWNNHRDFRAHFQSYIKPISIKQYYDAIFISDIFFHSTFVFKTSLANISLATNLLP